jgi:ribose transport system permease protein
MTVQAPSVPKQHGTKVDKPSAAKRDAVRHATDVGLRYATVGLLVLLLVVASFLNDRFWQLDNLRNVIGQNAPIGLVAIGMTYVIIAGGFDLSVGSIFAFSTLMVAKLVGDVPIWLAIVLTCSVGAAFGMANGLVVTRFKVNSFIATIGTGAIVSGLAFAFSNSQPIFITVPRFDTLGLGRVFGVPWAAVVLVLAFGLFGFVLSRTVYGRWVYAVGGNINAARLVGIRVDLVRVSTFAAVGLLAALAGVLLASQLSVGEPTLGGQTALDAFAIVVIGGTSVYGGEGALWRTAVGLTILAVLDNLFNTLSLSNADQSIAKGTILVLALGLNALSRARSA